MNRKQTVKGYLLVIFSAVIFGCLPMLVKGIYADGVNSLSVIFFRNLLSAPVAGVMAFCRHKSLRIPRKALSNVAALGIMGCCVAPLLLFSSYFFIASGTATIFHFVYPAAVVLGGILFFREKLTMGNLVSVLTCVAGICLFYTPGEPLDWRGSALALASGVAYAVYVLLLSHFQYQQVKGTLLNFYVFSINAAVMLMVCLLGDCLTLPATLTGWGLCFLLAIAVNVVAVAMFQQGTFLIGGARAAVLSTLEPITSVFLGALVFHEVISLRTGIGSVLVILASVLVVFFDSKQAQ